MNNPGAARRTFLPALAAAFALSGAISAQQPQPMHYALLAATDKAQDQPSEDSVVVMHQKLAALLRDRYGFKTDELYEATRQTILDALVGMAGRAASGDDVLIVLTLPSINIDGNWLFATVDANPEKTWTLISHLEIARLFTGKSYVEGANILLILPNCDFDESIDEVGGAPEGGISAITYCQRSGTRANPGQALVSVLEANAERQLPPALLAESLGQNAPELRFRYKGARRSVTLTPRRSIFDTAADYLETPRWPAHTVEELRKVTEYLGGKPIENRSQPGVERLENRVLDLARDPEQSSWVRATAISTLGYLRSRDAYRTLDSILADTGNAEERRAALQALAMIGGEPLAELLRRAFKNSEPTVRREAVSLAGVRGEASVVPELITIANKDPDERVQVTALQVLAILDPGDSREKVLFLVQARVHDPSLEISREALATLGALGAPLTRSRLLLMRDKEEPASFRQALAYAMPKLFRERDRSIVENVLSTAATPENPSEVRVAALWALGEIGGAAAERALLLAVIDDQDEVRVAAAEGLGKTRSERAIPMLADALLKDSPTVRVAAAQTLGTIGDTRALEPLFQAVKDEDIYVRNAAKAALEKIKSQPQPEDLVPRLADSSPDVRLAAVKLLTESSSPSAAALLIDKLADDDFYIRQVAIEGLGRHRNETCLRALIQTLDDPNALKRQGAAATLAAFGGTEAKSALIRHFNDPEPAVRREVVRSLIRLDAGDLNLFLAAANDADAGVRLESGLGLLKFAAPDAEEALEKLLRDAAPEVRLRTVEVLRIARENKDR